MSKGQRHREADAARKYQAATKLLSAGATIPQACRKLSISEATVHHWRRKFAPPARASPPTLITRERGPPGNGNSRLKQLEKENKPLKLLVAELTLKISFMKDHLEDQPLREKPLTTNH